MSSSLWKYPTRFHTLIPHHDFVCSYTYSYSPQDHRANDRIRRNHKQGCLASFSIKKEYLRSDATTISFYHMTHTRLDGSLIHGVGDEDSNSRASQLAPSISHDAKSFIWNRLDVGFTSKQIFDKHLRIWQERKTLKQPMRKDDYMTMENIRNLEKRHSKGKWKRHNSEGESVQPWIKANQESIFIIQWWGVLQTFHMINNNHSSWEFNLLNNER